VQGLVRLRGPGARAAARRPCQRHRRPDGRVDSPATRGRVPPGTPARATCCATAMRFTGARSQVESRPWGSTKSRRRLGRLGRIRTWNGSSAPFVASASTIWWC
jgi:hypothetical protein